MIKKNWNTANPAMRAKLRLEMTRRLKALKPAPGMLNREYGALAALAREYGMTSARFLNLIKGPIYRQVRRDRLK